MSETLFSLSPHPHPTPRNDCLHASCCGAIGCPIAVVAGTLYNETVCKAQHSNRAMAETNSVQKLAEGKPAQHVTECCQHSSKYHAEESLAYTYALRT
jgi:hypothetical protein